MCAYARDLALGVLPGAYSDDDARRYARGALISLALAEGPGFNGGRAGRRSR